MSFMLKRKTSIYFPVSLSVSEAVSGSSLMKNETPPVSFKVCFMDFMECGEAAVRCTGGSPD